MVVSDGDYEGVYNAPFFICENHTSLLFSQFCDISLSKRLRIAKVARRI